ncbi:MAG: hypothetical protein K0R15_1464 [Clostridiales bacterium]|jgi:hypothetical protein|nr:hypothetical protein [Clostridiales bacterium]
MKRKTFSLIGIILVTVFISNIAFINQAQSLAAPKLDTNLYCEGDVPLNILIETRSIRISNLF